MKTLREQMLAAGITEDQLGNWCSDLYVLKSLESTKVLESYEFKSNVTTFVSEAEPYKGKVWYDIPFGCMDEYIVKRSSHLMPTIEQLQKFFKSYPSFLGNRERSTIFATNAYIVDTHDYPGCYVVVNPDHDGDNTVVISWDQKGIKKGTIRG